MSSLFRFLRINTAEKFLALDMRKTVTDSPREFLFLLLTSTKPYGFRVGYADPRHERNFTGIN